MRMSDWSSDVCSSDLFGERLEGGEAALLQLVELHSQNGQRGAKEQDGKRAADAVDEATLGNPHHPQAVGDVEALFVCVPADSAAPEGPPRRATFAGPPHEARKTAVQGQSVS